MSKERGPSTSTGLFHLLVFSTAYNPLCSARHINENDSSTPRLSLHIHVSGVCMLVMLSRACSA